MRLIYLFLITILISSCASNKIRLVKNKDFHRTVIAVDTEIQEEENTLVNSNDESANEIVSESISALDEVRDDNKQSKKPSKKQVLRKKKRDNEEIIFAARQAERKAKAARNQAFIGGGLTLISFIPFFIVGALTMLIIALINYSKANSSRYITPDGEGYLKTSRIVLIVFGVIFLILIASILAFIFL